MPKKKTAGQGAAKEAAAVKKTAATKPPAKAKAAKTVITIDYPQEGEIVTTGSYTFRVTAERPLSVDISLDGKTWRAARECVGHWWYDWSSAQSGPCMLVARMTGPDGESVKTKPRQFTVLL